jgi:hypothetical protein
LRAWRSYGERAERTERLDTLEDFENFIDYGELMAYTRDYEVRNLFVTITIAEYPDITIKLTIESEYRGGDIIHECVNPKVIKGGRTYDIDYCDDVVDFIKKMTPKKSPTPKKNSGTADLSSVEI